MKFKLSKKNNKFYLLSLVISLLLFSLGLFYYLNKNNRENFLLYLHKDPSFINDNSNSINNFVKDKDPMCFSNDENICSNRINLDKFIVKYTKDSDKDEIRFKSGFEDYCKDGNNPILQGKLFNECPNQCYKLAETINELDSELFNDMKNSHKNLNKYIEKCV